MPAVTVIIPVFNAGPYVRTCLMSLFKQTYVNFEVILVDDGSTDDSVEKVRAMICDDERFQLYIRDRGPKGAGTCRNIAMQHAKGRYIMFLDSDDLLAPRCLEDRVSYMEQRPELDFAVFQIQSFGKINCPMTHTKSDYLRSFAFMDLPWTTTGPIWKANYLIGSIAFDERLPRLQDPDLHIQALINNPIFIVEAERPRDSFYRQHRSPSDQVMVEKKRWLAFLLYIEKYAPVFHRQPNLLGWWHRPFLMCASIFLRGYIMPKKRPLVQLLTKLYALGEVSRIRYTVVRNALYLGPSLPMPFRSLLIRLAMFTLNPTLYRKEFTSRFGI